MRRHGRLIVYVTRSRSRIDYRSAMPCAATHNHVVISFWYSGMYCSEANGKHERSCSQAYQGIIPAAPFLSYGFSYANRIREVRTCFSVFHPLFSSPLTEGNSNRISHIHIEIRHPRKLLQVSPDLQICFLQVFAVPPNPATSGSESSSLPREEEATMATSNSDHDSTQYEKTGHVAQHVVDVGDAAAQGHLATDQ